MSTLYSGQWRCFRGIPRLPLIAAAWILLAPAVAITQDSADYFVPDLESDLLLMAELVEVKAKVTFAEPAGVSSVNDLQVGLPGEDLTHLESVTVAPDGDEGGTKSVADGHSGPQSAAALTVDAVTSQPISILVDQVVTDTGISLAEFTCTYKAGNDVPCDVGRHAEATVGSGTLLVGVTVIGIDTLIAGTAEGSFDVTVSYQ